MQFSLKLATPIRHWRVFKINAIFTQRWSCSSFVEDVSPRLIFSPCRIRLPSEPGCCTGLCHPKLHWLSRRNLPCLSAGTICIGVLLGSMTKTNAPPDGNLKTHMKSYPGCRSICICRTQNCTLNWLMAQLTSIYGHITKMDGLTVESCCIFYLGNTHIKNRYHQIGRETGFWDIGELMLPKLQYGNGTIFPCVAVFSSSLYSFLSAFDGSYLLPTSSDLSPTCHWNHIFQL